MSAYACEPGKGSEPEVGWRWALQMARFHDVTVLTRANNRPTIDAAVESLKGRQPLPTFVYHDRGRMLLDLKRRAGATKLYYLLWQRSAREVAVQLHQIYHYDLMHHVTFAGFRYPTVIWGHGVPTIWGPIGGIESIPRPLLPWKHPVSLRHEVFRNLNNLIQAAPFQVLPKRAAATTLILTSTPEMQRTFAKLGFTAEVMPTVGLNPADLPYQAHARREGPLKLLFVGNIITLKGVDLAIEALARSQSDATLTLIGSGDFQAAAARLAQRLGLSDRVTFRGRLSRTEVLKVYPDYDAFLFPSLHDTGGYAMIEAMFNELPVICLDCGGPAVAVSQGCGVKVRLGPRTAVVNGLASAISTYARNREAVRTNGAAARERILLYYDWSKKGEEMNQRYQQALAPATRQVRTARRGYAGMGGMTSLMHGVFSLRGLAAAMLGILLIGGAGFLSVGRLKTDARQIVSDTLPGLSSAGEANASLAQAFNRTLLLLMADSPERRARLREEVEAFSQATMYHMEGYRRQIYQPTDQLQFDRLLKRRGEYLDIRRRVLDLAENNQRAEALALCEKELLPAYAQYKQAGDKLFEFNMHEGEVRGRNIMKVCTVTQFVVAAIGILIFILGFVIGLFK
jgi:glycosyltransferase involved in cell wall biosynthesis